MKNIIIFLAMFISLSMSGQTFTSKVVLYRDHSGSMVDSLDTTVKLKRKSLSITDRFSTETYVRTDYDKFMKTYLFENEFSKVRIIRDGKKIYVTEEPIIGAYRMLIAESK